MSNRPFDLGKLEFDKRRKEKRKKLLLFALPGVALLLVIGLLLILPTAITSIAKKNFDKGEYAKAASGVSLLGFVNLIEPYKAHYNHGTSLSAKGDYDAAIQELESALAFTDDKEVVCVITYNLVLTMEGSGDSMLKQANLSGAITLYTRAINRIKANADCFKDSGLQKRIEEKLKATEEARAKQGKDGDKEPEETATESPNATQQAKLKEIEEAATRERNETDSYNDDYVTPDPGVKPW
jgi:tetratricopeptide (TPR) repeat protein